MITKISKELIDAIFPIGCVICIPFPEPPDYEGVKWALLNTPNKPAMLVGNDQDRDEGVGIHTAKVVSHNHEITSTNCTEATHSHGIVHAWFGKDYKEGDKSRVGRWTRRQFFAVENGIQNENGYPMSQVTAHDHTGRITLTHHTDGEKIDHKAVLANMCISGYYYTRID